MIREENDPEKAHPDAGDEPPPFMRTWNRLYGSIIIYTLALILALYLMTIALNR
jgi:hypothetical protein